jgi:hypothetical protein
MTKRVAGAGSGVSVWGTLTLSSGAFVEVNGLEVVQIPVLLLVRIWPRHLGDALTSLLLPFSEPRAG